MEPIVSPLWFYLIDVVTSLRAVSLTTGFLIWGVLGIASIGILFWSVDSFKDFWSYKHTKPIAIAGFISIIIGCLIPCTEAAYQMLIASLVTPDNIAALGDSASNIVDYIIESVDKLIESNQ